MQYAMKFMFDLMPYLCNSVNQNHSNAFILRPVTLYTSQKISYRVTNGLYERAVRRKGYDDMIGRYPCSLAESDTRKIFVSKTVARITWWIINLQKGGSLSKQAIDTGRLRAD